MDTLSINESEMQLMQAFVFKEALVIFVITSCPNGPDKKYGFILLDLMLHIYELG